MAITADITIAQTAGSDTAAYPYMLAPGSAVMQDITPASVRRSDGDTRFQTLQTEGFYAQSNWQGGFGVRHQLDPNSFWKGTADTSFANQATCGQAPQDVSVSGRYPSCFIEHGNDLYAFFTVPSSTDTKLYRRTGTGVGAWTDTGYAPAGPPTSGCSFRNKLYIALGSSAFVEEIETATYTDTTMTFKAEILEPYGSMLHYAYYDSSGAAAWRLGRWDPDNADTINVANFQMPASLPPRAMRAAYGSLFITFNDSLWQYTSQNGNSGVLIGPVDRWAMTEFSGSALEAHDGALVYNAGPLLRRFPPGGSPRTLFPTPPREATNDTNWGEPVGLRSVSGRLYVLVVKQAPFTGLSYPYVPTVQPDFFRIHCWTGVGMHLVASEDHTYNAVDTSTRFCLAYDRQTSLFIGSTETLTRLTAGKNAVRILIPILTGSIVQDAALYYTGLRPTYQASYLETGRLEFGLADVLKSLRRLRYRAGSGGTIVVKITTDDTNWTTLVASGTAYAPTGQHDQGFNEIAVPANGTLTAPWFRIRVELTPGSSGGYTTTPILTALAAIPNPALPLRNGFKLSIPIGRNVEDYNGNVMYPDDDEVAAALARVKAFRATGDSLDAATNAPLSLVWVDGNTYIVRANTRVIQRQRTSKNAGKYWVLTLDLQEIT